MAEQERKTWLRRRVEDGMRRGFQHAYETVKVDPSKFLLQCVPPTVCRSQVFKASIR